MGELQQLIQALQAMQGNSAATKTVGALATALPYGSGMFAYNTEADIISALVDEDVLSRWLGFLPSTTEVRTNKFLDWVGPQGTAAGSPEWHRSAACGDCPSVEWGKCETISCFGELCVASPVLSLTQVGLKAWEGQPMYRLFGPMGGQQIRNDEEWMLAICAAVMNQNLQRQIVQGNKTAEPREFDGLEQIINTPVVDYRTGVRCQAIEPVIYDWGDAAMTKNICQIVTDLVRRIRMRGQFIGSINSAVGDMVLLMTPTMRDALLDWAACGCGPCSGSAATVNIDALQSRTERARLAGGLYGMGQFEVDGTPVPIIATGWIPESQMAGGGAFCSDIYILTRRVGARPVLFGEFQDFAATLSGVDIAFNARAKFMDNGRFLAWPQSNNECYFTSMLMKGRLINAMPWLQGRISGVCAPFNIAPINPIPADNYWFAKGEVAAEAQSLYFYGPC